MYTAATTNEIAKKFLGINVGSKHALKLDHFVRTEMKELGCWDDMDFVETEVNGETQYVTVYTNYHDIVANLICEYAKQNKVEAQPKVEPTVEEEVQVAVEPTVEEVIETVNAIEVEVEEVEPTVEFNYADADQYADQYAETMEQLYDEEYWDDDAQYDDGLNIDYYRKHKYE
jgi:hypothetical protein